MKKSVLKVSTFAFALLISVSAFSTRTIAIDNPDVPNTGYSTMVGDLNMCVSGGVTCDGTAVVIEG